MRAVVHQDGVSVHAIAGTHVVLFGFNLAAAQRPGCLGFAVQRQALPAGPAEWLKGLKTFAGGAPRAGGQSVSSREQPLQTFVWGDYGARPGQPYRYTVVPLYGAPTALREGSRLAIEVTTEPEAGQPHSIYFNRGAAASQQYALRFGNQPPEAVANGEAFTWLSRGLLEGLLAFIDRARDATYSLHGAVYEFQLPAALAALQSARQQGAALHLVYDAIPGKGHPGPKMRKLLSRQAWPMY